MCSLSKVAKARKEDGVLEINLFVQRYYIFPKVFVTLIELKLYTDFNSRII